MAGVSASTVSRVLSRPDLVTESTRLLVAAAVTATGYQINEAARNLRKQRTGSVVALVPNLANPFFAKILDGMGRELGLAGYDLLVADSLDTDGMSTNLGRFLDRSRADGVVLLDGLVAPALLLGETRRTDLPPVIFACEWNEESDLPKVIYDNHHGAYLAVSHLRLLGHRRISVISGPENNVLHKTRLQGASDAMGGDKLTIMPGDFTLEAGKNAARLWLRIPAHERPTGVFAFSDVMAYAFISELSRNGISVPDDISVVGFDDIELASYLHPALTTIRQPKRDLGAQAAHMIVNCIAGNAPVNDIVLPANLTLRDTTSAPA